MINWIQSLWLAGILAADEKEPAASTAWSWQNFVLVGGLAVAILTALIALYRASAQKGLDQGTKQKIDEEVRRLQTDHDRRRTVRVLRLERYVDHDITYHRLQKIYLNKLTDLLEQAIREGFLPEVDLPRPPDPPELPEMPEGDNYGA
jgi:hypothetical protein